MSAVRNAQSRHPKCERQPADISKFYERISHQRLLREASAVGFPLRFLRAACALYKGPRVLRLGQTYSQLVRTEGTVIAGCSHANTLARFLCFRLLEKLGNAMPSAHLNNIVDDFSLQVLGSQRHVVAVVTRAGNELVDGLTELQLKVNLDSA